MAIALVIVVLFELELMMFQCTISVKSEVRVMVSCGNIPLENVRWQKEQEQPINVEDSV